ncbi:PilW family protein [Ramlibacter sp. 2FC]|uniref:PilW family protein n=1 Tax=Ramlibacter sp. 2FC TaxID=2502188 RepID=UPI0010F79AED|nr:PilW family protein [Ramlibacter sp. 2FC]
MHTNFATGQARRWHGRRAERGLSLVELMVAMALGLMIMTALAALYGSMSRTNNEMAKTNQLIENGRFAVQLLQGDLVHAGFWGPLDTLQATAVPDPCLVYANWPTDATALAEYKVNLMAIPVQGYADGSALAGCGVASVSAKSDVLLVRHASTCVAGGCDGGADAGPHIQISSCRTDAPPEPAYLLDANPASLTLRLKNCTTVAPRRQMLVNLYYVSTNGSGMPRLMRKSFKEGAYAASAEALIEGIEAFRVEYGVDNLGSNGLPISASNPGDGNADSYVSCAPSCDLATLSNVVAVKVHVLARNLEPTAGYKDEKSYQLGPLAIAAANDSYKRHVFSTTVRLVNPSSRREQP